MTQSIPQTLPEALRLANYLEKEWVTGDCLNAASELRRLHAENAALAAHPLVGVIPEGMTLVPIEATQEMVDAYLNVGGRFQSARSDWAAMLAAAPAPKMQSEAAHDVLAERARQLAKWGNDHDDGHGYDHLASQAADFILPGQFPIKGVAWAYKSKVTDGDPRRLQLVKGAALAISAIDAYDRAEKVPAP